MKNGEQPVGGTGPLGGAGHVMPYEQHLNQQPKWALGEGSRFFEEKGAVHDVLRKITSRLDQLGIAYAVVGGLALFHHGYRRFTEIVELLVTREGLKVIHEKLEGPDYLPPFPRSKNLRDVELGVKIEFVACGDFPGDGKPKPVAFPDPARASHEVDGVRFLNLNSLIELKLASGMTSAARLQDLSDVLELIKTLDLPLDYANSLNPYVQARYEELAQAARRQFICLWRNKSVATDAISLDEMIDRLSAEIDELRAMKEDGIVLDPDGASSDGYARLITSDPKVAQKYGMEDESEFWGENGAQERAVAGEETSDEPRFDLALPRFDEPLQPPSEPESWFNPEIASFGAAIETGTVRFERLLPGPIERVWAYLTESEKRGQWLASGEMEPRLGGSFFVELRFHHASLSPKKTPTPERFKEYENGYVSRHRLTRFEPPKVLSFTWGGTDAPSEVIFELTARGDKVLLVLTHRRLSGRSAMADVACGWHTHLAVLVECLNGREPPSFWSLFAEVSGEYEKRFAEE